MIVLNDQDYLSMAQGGDIMMQWALDMLYLIQQLREDWGESGIFIMNLISEYGLIYAIALPMIIYWCFDKRAGYEIMMVITGGNTMNHLVKLTTCVERPWLLDKRITPPEVALKNQGGYSFPSGHTQVGTAYLGGTAHWLRKGHKVIAVLLWTVAVLVGLSRMYLGVHTIFDIAGGILETVIMIFVASKVFDYAWKSERNLTRTVLIGLIISAVAVLYIMFKPYPVHYYPDGTMMTDPKDMIIYNSMGGFAGFLSGMWIEQRFIRFRTDITAKQKVLRFVIGAVFYALLNQFIPTICVDLMGVWPGSFIYNFILMLFPTAIYPLIFHKISWLGGGQEPPRDQS